MKTTKAEVSDRKSEVSKPATIKVWSLAGDGPKCGTFGSAHATEAAAYTALLEQLNLADDDASTALLEAGELDALQELLEDSTDGLTTWTIDENEVASPVFAELLEALQLMLTSFESHFPVGIEVSTARAAIAKATGGKL